MISPRANSGRQTILTARESNPVAYLSQIPSRLSTIDLRTRPQRSDQAVDAAHRVEVRHCPHVTRVSEALAGDALDGLPVARVDPLP